MTPRKGFAEIRKIYGMCRMLLVPLFYKKTTTTTKKKQLNIIYKYNLTYIKKEKVLIC